VLLGCFALIGGDYEQKRNTGKKEANTINEIVFGSFYKKKNLKNIMKELFKLKFQQILLLLFFLGFTIEFYMGFTYLVLII
jgi:hypothetical protein